ncbi:MAG: hypothetical protein RL238_815 [Actinomycetota bacterium]
MSSTTAPVTLRYRPGADVLSGVIHLGEVDAHQLRTDAPDADTSVEWAPVADGDAAGHPHLHRFQFVFAAARFAEGRLPLPAALQPVVESLITTAHHALHEVDDPLARARALANATATVPLAQLRRTALPALCGGTGAPPPGQAAAVSRSLRQVAEAVHRRDRTDQLARLLRELGSTVDHARGMAAPGTAAAAAAAARATPALTEQERHHFHDALEQLLAPANWQAADTTLQHLLTSLERAPR